MMKITLLALAALVLVVAEDAASESKPNVTIVSQDSEVDLDKYSFEFETSDGTSRQEQGEYKNDTDQQGLLVKGSYRYVAPDGQHIAVTYIADKNGYQPTEQKDGDQSSAGSAPGAASAPSTPAAAAPQSPAEA